MKYCIGLISLFFLFACSESHVQTSLAQKQQHYSETAIKAADISDDGQYALISHNDKVCLWNNQLNQKVYPCLKGLEAQLIELLGISKNNKFFYTSNRVNIHLYDLATGRLITVWTAGDNIINDIAMSDNENTLVFGFRSGQASVVSVTSNKVITYKPHRLDINSVSISADGTKAFTGSSDKTAVLWNTTNGQSIHSFKHASRVNHVVMSADAKVAFTLDAIKDRFFWLLKIGKKFTELSSNIKFIEFNDSAIVNNNKWLLSASPKQKLQLWQVKDGTLLGEWQAYKNEKKYRASVITIKLINSKEIATISSDGVFEIWPLHSAK
ncbi:WD40 repeat domain-containing protein [Colwelliaceae bacterium 6441]